MGGGFALLAALFAPDDFRRGVMRGDVKPARKGAVALQRGGLAGEGNEHRLGDVLREMGVPADAAQGGGMDHDQVSMHQRGERVLGVFLDKTAEQNGVFVHGNLPLGCRPIANRTNNFGGRISVERQAEAMPRFLADGATKSRAVRGLPRSFNSEI